MNSTILRFPHPKPQRLQQRTLTPTEQAALNRARRPHLLDPTQDALTNCSLDLASQAGITIARIHGEIVNGITRDRLRRLFGTTPCNI